VVANLMRARWGDQRNEALDELGSLHQDVGGSVAPGGLEPQGEHAVAAFLEPLARNWWPRDVAAEPLEPFAVRRWNGDACVQAHAAKPGHTIGIFGVDLRRAHRVARLDPIAHAPPGLTPVRSRRDSSPD